MISSEQGLPQFLAWATILRGWGLARPGNPDEGIALIHQGLRAHEATGAALGRPSLLGMLADTYGKAGQPEAGLRVLNEALALVSNTGECFDEATLNRLQGELMLQMSGQNADSSATEEAAQACFQKAINLARQQSAKSIELQGALCLARFWRRQGKNDAARQILIEIEAAFPEETNTVDVCQARELLKNLS